MFNIGDIALPLADHMTHTCVDSINDSAIVNEFALETVPIHSTLVRIGDTSVLVDAGNYDAVPGTQYEIEGYASPPHITEQN